MDNLDFINQILDTFIPEGDFSVKTIAEKVTKFMVEQEPEFLQEFSGELFNRWLVEHLRTVSRNRRRELFRATREGNIRDTLDKISTGDKEALDVFKAAYCINEENVWRHVGDMSAKDHIYVATQYENSAKRDLMLSAFHKAVAKIVGDKATSDAMTEEEYVKLYAKFVKE